MTTLALIVAISPRASIDQRRSVLIVSMETAV
jgi:hypothetical protein